MTESLKYSPTEFQQKLSDVQDSLAELRYIDTATAYLESQQASMPHVLASNPVFGAETSNIEVAFGGSIHPFTRVYQLPEDSLRFIWQDTRKEQVESQLEVLHKEAKTWAATEIEGIAGSIEPYIWPVGSLHQSGCIDPVRAAHTTLNTDVRHDFGALRHSLGDWDGEAADNFASRFYSPFDQTLRGQKHLLLALAGGIATAKAIAESTQHSLMNVVHYTHEALGQQLEQAEAEASLAREEARRNALIIAGASATIVAGVVGGPAAGAAIGVGARTGGLWGLSLSAVDAAANVATTAIPDGAWNVFELYGVTAQELARSMSEAVRTIIDNDQEQYKELVRQPGFVM